MTNKSISQLTAGGAVSSTDLFPDVQTVGVGPVKVTAAQIGTYVLTGTGMTGALPVTLGGTGTSTAFTTGSIVFAGASGVYSQKNANLFWDNTNNRLGIGTAAPSTTIDVIGNGRFANTIYVDSVVTVGAAAGSTGVQQRLVFNDGTYQTGMLQGFGSAYGGGFNLAVALSSNATNSGPTGSTYSYAASSYATRYIQASGAHIWNYAASGTAGNTISWSEAMRIDSAGNVGIGVVPNTFSGGKAIEIGAAGNAINGYEASNILITAGAYYNSGWKYANSLFAVAEYQQYRGEHRWYNAPSGTTGNAVTFTQAMTLDTSGRLGIATTSPATTLDVNGNIRGAQIYSTPTALTSGATITWNANTSPIATLTLNQVGATLTMSNLVAGSTYILTVTQGAGGSKTITTWTNFKWPSGVAPTLSTAAGAIDVITAYTDGTYLYATAQIGFV